jgi:hypothetical protein
MMNHDECGGCPGCESEPCEVAECVGCGETKDITPDSDDHGDPYCAPCWDDVTHLWACMDAEDRVTRGQEGGWCDL